MHTNLHVVRVPDRFAARPRSRDHAIKRARSWYLISSCTVKLSQDLRAPQLLAAEGFKVEERLFTMHALSAASQEARFRLLLFAACMTFVAVMEW